MFVWSLWIHSQNKKSQTDTSWERYQGSDYFSNPENWGFATGIWGVTDVSKLASQPPQSTGNVTWGQTLPLLPRCPSGGWKRIYLGAKQQVQDFPTRPLGILMMLALKIMLFVSGDKQFIKLTIKYLSVVVICLGNMWEDIILCSYRKRENKVLANAWLELGLWTYFEYSV